MKNFLYLLAMVLTISALSCDRKSLKTSVPETSLEESGSGQAAIEFDASVNDLGTISEGEQVMAWFTYKNTGDAPLAIQNIDAGCGCTVPSWNDKPLAPGEEESIKVIFNSRGKNGSQNIRVTVYSNAQNSVEELRIKATVISKP